MAANAMTPVRTIKIRSVVDAQYTKYYNRLEFNIDPDSWSTDLSESYLALRMYLAHDGSPVVKYTSAELQSMAAAGVFVSFGNAGVSYAPTCLIKLARLYARNNQSTPLEEINFQNVLTETLHQICEDFESVGSSSLLSNTSVSFGAPQSLTSFFANLLPDTVGASDQQLPIEVHIPLKKIFGFFENKNCYLDDEALGGLRLVFELEDTKTLLQANVKTQNVLCPPVVSGDLYSGLVPTLEVNPYTSLTEQVQVGQATLLSGSPLVPEATTLPALALPGNIANPASFTLQDFQIESITDDTATVEYELRGSLWTDAILESMWIVAGNWARVNIKVSPASAGQFANERQSVMMAYMARVLAVTTVANVTTVILEGTTSIPADPNWTYATQRLEFFDVAQPVADPQVVPQHFGQHIIALDPVILVGSGAPTVPTTLKQNQIVVGDLTLQAMVAAGLVATDGGTTFVPNGAQFTLSCQVQGSALVEGDNVVPYQPNFTIYTSPDNANIRTIQSNMLQKVPIQGDKTQILSVAAAEEGFWTVTFGDLGFANGNSLIPQLNIDGVFVKNGDLFPETAAVTTLTYNFFITNFNDATVEYDASGGKIACSLPDYTWLIDKSELVLVQQGRQKGVPMSRMYFTTKVEAATIETELPVYTRQFIVTEPNVYSILLCTPQYVASATQPECLASWHRGVSQYRFAVNNIDDTNRNLEVWTNNSHYPSSLHLEKLMDALQNDGHAVKSLSGLLTVPQTALPIVSFPLKVYDVMDSPVGYRMHPEGYVVQWTAYGDTIHNSPVQPGNIYLFKRLVKTF